MNWIATLFACIVIIKKLTSFFDVFRRINDNFNPSFGHTFQSLTVCFSNFCVIQNGTKWPVLNRADYKGCWHWGSLTEFKRVFIQHFYICISLVDYIPSIKANELKCFDVSACKDSVSHLRIFSNHDRRVIKLIMKKLDQFFIFFTQPFNVTIKAWIENEIPP